jgi:hypothetical protein
VLRHVVVERVHGQRESAADAERDRRVDRRQPLRVEERLKMCVKGSGSPGGVAVWAKTVVDVVDASRRIAAIGARCIMRHTSYVASPSAAPL